MRTTVHFDDFRHAFNAIRPDNFSREGLEQLFDYFEAYERDTGEEIELDVISICCDFSEDTPEAIAENYSIDTEGMTEGQALDEVIETLKTNGAYIGQTSSGSIVYQNY